MYAEEPICDRLNRFDSRRQELKLKYIKLVQQLTALYQRGFAESTPRHVRILGKDK